MKIDLKRRRNVGEKSLTSAFSEVMAAERHSVQRGHGPKRACAEAGIRRAAVEEDLLLHVNIGEKSAALHEFPQQIPVYLTK